MIKIFFCRMNIYLRKIYICSKNIFCIKIYFSNEIYIFYIFIYIFLCRKIFFSVKQFFNISLVFQIKTFFSGNNAYFVKNRYFSKKHFFFLLVLQQMNNHSSHLQGSFRFPVYQVLKIRSSCRSFLKKSMYLNFVLLCVFICQTQLDKSKKSKKLEISQSLLISTYDINLYK